MNVALPAQAPVDQVSPEIWHDVIYPEKTPLFRRLDINFLLKLLDLERILIGRSSIRILGFAAAEVRDGCRRGALISLT